MNRRFDRAPAGRRLAACLLFLICGSARADLTLAESERIALDTDPTVARRQALAESLGADAVAERQLPDPRLRLGVESFPTRSLSLTAEPMTQAVVGVMQELPAGDTLELKGRSAELRAGGEQAKGDDQKLKALRGVRESYLDAWFRRRNVEALEQNRSLLDRLLGIMRAQYASGRDNRQEVLAAQLELSRSEDRIAEMKSDEERARAGLSRWLGAAALGATLARDTPALPEPAPLPALVDRLPHHPRLRAAEAQVAAGEQEVAIAKQAYKPSFDVELTYGKRFGQEADGSARSDLASAMVTMGLPVFTEKRQDQRLAARQKEAMAMRYERDGELREMRAELEGTYAEWLRLRERVKRYRGTLLPQAEQAARSATEAYQSKVTAFSELMRAYIARVDTRLELLRLEVQEAKARAQLAYFAGDLP